MTRERVRSWWSSQGASPRWAEERLTVVDHRGLRRRRPASPAGSSPSARGVGADRPSLSVVVCADYLDGRPRRPQPPLPRVRRAVDAGQAQGRAIPLRPGLPAGSPGALLGLCCPSPARPSGYPHLPAQPRPARTPPSVPSRPRPSSWTRFSPSWPPRSPSGWFFRRRRRSMSGRSRSTLPGLRPSGILPCAGRSAPHAGDESPAPCRPAGRSGASETEPEQRAQQRRRALGAAGRDAGPLPPSGQSPSPAS